MYYPFERWSYLKNPLPTHIREKVTKALSAAGNAAVDYATDELSEAATKEAARATYEETGDLMETAENAANMYQFTQDVGNSVQFTGEGDVYYDGWFVFDNVEGRRVLLYKGNEEQVLPDILYRCDDYMLMDQRDAKKLMNVKKLDEVIQFMNKCQ